MALKVFTLDNLKYYHGKIKALLAGKVDKETGKSLVSDNEIAKLGTVAENAQVNVIETVKVGGTALEVTDKAVNIDLSAYAIKSEMETALDGKVDAVEGMGLMSDAEKAKIANLADDANATYATKAELSAIPKYATLPVESLPTENISETTIYLVPNEGSGTNARDEYIYVNGAWEMLGTTEVDLSGYYTSAQVDEKIAAIEGDVGAVYTKSEIDGMVEGINGDIEAVEGDLATLEGNVYTKGEVDSAIATATTDMATKSYVDGEVAKKADATHAHAIADVTGLQSALDAKAVASDVYTKSEADALLGAKANSADLAAVATSGKYSDLTGVPVVDTAISGTSTNAVENKAISAALDLKANAADVYAKSEVYTKSEVNDAITLVGFSESEIDGALAQA